MHWLRISHDDSVKARAEASRATNRMKDKNNHELVPRNKKDIMWPLTWKKLYCHVFDVFSFYNILFKVKCYFYVFLYSFT